MAKKDRVRKCVVCGVEKLVYQTITEARTRWTCKECRGKQNGNSTNK